jgi:hypothetical protein
MFQSLIRLFVRTATARFLMDAEETFEVLYRRLKPELDKENLEILKIDKDDVVLKHSKSKFSSNIPSLPVLFDLIFNMDSRSFNPLSHCQMFYSTCLLIDVQLKGTTRIILNITQVK